MSVSVWRKRGQNMFNPWLIIGAISTFIGVYFYGHHAGYQQRVDEDQAEIIRLNGEARAKEAELNQKIAVATTALRKAKDDVKTKQASTDARIDSGELRLPQATCGVPANPGTPAIAGDTANDAQSQREVLKAINGYTVEGDTAIISLNACIKQYNSVRETVNKGVK